jgi:plasmid maintenance system antidote protein VapI
MRFATGVSVADSTSGEIFNEEFLKPLGLTANALAKAIRVPMATVHFAAMTAALLAGWMALRAKG